MCSPEVPQHEVVRFRTMYTQGKDRLAQLGLRDSPLHNRLGP